MFGFRVYVRVGRLVLEAEVSEKEMTGEGQRTSTNAETQIGTNGKAKWNTKKKQSGLQTIEDARKICKKRYSKYQ